MSDRPRADPPEVVATRAELAESLTRAGDRRRAVVMTMGALHAGHAALIDAARDRVGSAGQVLVTVFVNPLQFGPGEDLERYPRSFDADLELCREHGVDVVFAPTVEVMYPNGDPQVSLDSGELGTRYEGSARPGHFNGVLTVVAKLLNVTKPDFAVFGEKDYQQLTLIRRMVADLDVEVEVIGVPTVRAEDGLALSSRNKYLTPADRVRALAIPAAIAAGQAAAAAGQQGNAIMAAAAAVLAATDGVRPDYVIVTDPAMGPTPVRGQARIIITALVGGTRLLDNARVDIGDDI
ncbi:MAG: pantoate--beta-alanine ligase [Actinomycetes bacterium]